MFTASTDIIIANIVEFFLILSVNGLTFSVEHGIGCDYAELFGLGGDYFELDGFEVASDDEEVSFFDGTVGIFEIWDEVGLGEITRNSLNCVLKG